MTRVQGDITAAAPMPGFQEQYLNSFTAEVFVLAAFG